MLRLKALKALDISWRTAMSAQTQRQFIAQEIDSWKPDHDTAMRVHDLENLIRLSLCECGKDDCFIRYILDRSRSLNRDELDDANSLIQECCGAALKILAKLRDQVRVAERMGFTLQHAADIAKAAEDYRRWQEDTPELLLLNHGPVQDQIRERIKAALNTPAPQSDWRDLFLEGMTIASWRWE
jgi:hypothetical protein